MSNTEPRFILSAVRVEGCYPCGCERCRNWHASWIGHLFRQQTRSALLITRTAGLSAGLVWSPLPPADEVSIAHHQSWRPASWFGLVWSPLPPADEVSIAHHQSWRPASWFGLVWSPLPPADEVSIAHYQSWRSASWVGHLFHQQMRSALLITRAEGLPVGLVWSPLPPADEVSIAHHRGTQSWRSASCTTALFIHSLGLPRWPSG